MDLFDLFARITMDTSDYEDGVKKSQDGFGKLQTGISNVKKVAAGISAALATVSTLIAKAGIEAAAEVRAETSAFQQTFGDMQEAASAAIGRVADDAGILQTRLNTLGSRIYAFARASGGDATESLSLMERALRVASDTAAYYDTSIEQATETLQSFLKGNFENDAALGLSATETTRNAEAMELFGKKYQELTEIQKQETLLKMVEDAQALSNVTGQAAREAGSWTNEVGDLKEAWRQFQARMGEPILDTVTPVVEDASDAVMWLTENWDDVTTAIEYATVAVGSMAAAMGAIYAGRKLANIATIFKANAEAIAFFSVQSGSAAVAQEVLAGTFSVTEIAVGVLTGKISLATAAQYAWNTAMNANPIGLVVTAVGLLGVAIHKSISDINELAEGFEIQAETSEDAAKHLEDLKNRLSEYERNPNKRTKQEREEYAALEKAIAATEEQIIELQKTEQETAAAAAQAAADPVNIFNQATEQYAQDATALYEKFVETYEGIYDQVSGWFKPFEEASVSVKTSIEDMMAAMQSQIEFNQTYSKNLQALKEYGLGSLSEAFQAYGAEGAAYAEAIVSAVEKAGGATSGEGAKIIQGFKDINQQVLDSQGELTQTVALMNGDLESELQDLNESYGAAVSGLDKSKEAKTAAETTFQSFIDGMNSKVPGILKTMEGIGDQITSSLQKGIDPIRITFVAEASGYSKGRNIQGFATGLDYVPYDNFLAYLHKGEAVLTAREAAAWRKGETDNANPGNGNIVINQYIESVPQTPVEFAAATEAYFEQARWAM